MRPLSTKGAAPTSLTRVRPSACRNCRRMNSVTRLSKTGSKVSLWKTGTAKCSPLATPGLTVVPNSYPHPCSTTRITKTAQDHLLIPTPLHEKSTRDADVAGGERVTPSGTLAERKAAHLSLRGCDREAA